MQPIKEEEKPKDPEKLPEKQPIKKEEKTCHSFGRYFTCFSGQKTKLGITYTYVVTTFIKKLCQVYKCMGWV